MQTWHMCCGRHEMQILQLCQIDKKGCIKNIKYIMLKHYKQEHLASVNITMTTVNKVQNMIECNSTISTKSQSKSNECTTIISTSSYVDSSTNTYQYHHFDHFDSQPNQMYFFSICSILFLVAHVA